MSGPNLGRLAEEALERRGDHPALVFGDRTWFAAELAERAARLGAGLQEAGVGPGDAVAVVMANCPEVGIAYQALWRIGAVVTPVVFLVTEPELRHVLTDSQAVAVLTTADLLGKATAAATGTAVQLLVVAGLGGLAAGDPPSQASPAPRVLAFAEVETAAAGGIVERDADDLAALMYTGGTTGRAKGVMLSHRNLWFCSHSSHQASHVPGLTRSLNALPVSHAYGLIVTLTGLHAPEPQLGVLMAWFDPQEWVRLAAEHRVQRAVLVPAMLAMLLGQPLEAAGLDDLRYVNVGAAPLAASLLEQAERRLPGLTVLEGYGCTESGAVVSVNRPGERRLGTVGRAIPGYEVRVVDDDDVEVPAGVDGEICARSPGVMSGYWREPELSAQVLRGGWLHTGDVGHVDDDGFISVVDRKKDLIIRGGFNVFPRDVEDVLAEHPAVVMAGVVGRPDARLGEEVVAFVSLRPGATAGPEDLVRFCRERLAASKYPREVRVVDALPLTSVGKLDRKALRASARA